MPREPMTPPALPIEPDPNSALVTARIGELKRKLAARSGKMEYRDNIPMLEAEIRRLEAQR